MQTLKSCNDLCHMAERWVRFRGKKSSRHIVAQRVQTEEILNVKKKNDRNLSKN